MLTDLFTGAATGAGTAGGWGSVATTTVLKSVMGKSIEMFTKLRGDLEEISTGTANAQDKIKELMTLLPMFQSYANTIKTAGATASEIGQQTVSDLESMIATIRRVDQTQSNNQTFHQTLDEAIQKAKNLAATAQQVSTQNTIANGGFDSSS